MMFALGVTMGDGCMTLDDVMFCVSHGVTDFRINLANDWGRRHALVISQVLAQVRLQHGALRILWDVPFPNKKSRYRTYLGQRYDIARGDHVVVIPSSRPQVHAGQISVPESLFEAIKTGDRLVVGDGETMLVAGAVSHDAAVCSVTDNWFVSDGKSLTIENHESVLHADLDDLPLDIVQADGLPTRFACSFIRHREDVSRCRRHLPPASTLMAKVETRAGVTNAREILQHADSVMVARGDLALNMGFAALGRAQQALIDVSNAAGKPVHVATEILSSLSFRSTPLRAEVSDLFHVCRHIDQGGLFLTKESSMPEMLRKSLPLIAEIARDARADRHPFHTPEV
jgi:pyruvate kinase